MHTFYVRPRIDGGYGRGDGTSFDNAWNGFEAVDWNALAETSDASLWVCSGACDGEAPGKLLVLYVEWNGRGPFGPSPNGPAVNFGL